VGLNLDWVTTTIAFTFRQPSRGRALGRPSATSAGVGASRDRVGLLAPPLLLRQVRGHQSWGDREFRRGRDQQRDHGSTLPLRPGASSSIHRIIRSHRTLLPLSHDQALALRAPGHSCASRRDRERVRRRRGWLLAHARESQVALAGRCMRISARTWSSSSTLRELWLVAGQKPPRRPRNRLGRPPVVDPPGVAETPRMRAEATVADRGAAGVVFQGVHCAPPRRRSLDADNPANSGGLCLRPL